MTQEKQPETGMGNTTQNTTPKKIAILTIKSSSEFAKKYQEQIRKVREWGNAGFNYKSGDKDVPIINEFLSGDNVAGVGQGRFTNKIKEKIKDNWNKVKEKLEKIKGTWDDVKEKHKNTDINQYCKDLQDCIIECCKSSGAKSTPWASIHAMIAVLKPDTFCTIVSENNIDQLYKFLCELKEITPEQDSKTADSGGTPKNAQGTITIDFNSDEWEDFESAWKKAKEKGKEMAWYEKSQATHKFFKGITSDTYYTELNYPWETLVVLRGEERIKILAEKLKLQKNLILTGAPGTGKTYLAKEIANVITRDNNIDNNAETEKTVEENEAGAPQKNANAANYVGFVQFHPSYDYTDFVEGLRPKGDGSGVSFEFKPGIFRSFCAGALEAWNNTYKAGWKKSEDEKKEEYAYNYAVTNAPKFVFIIDEINRGEISKIFGELFFSIDPGYRGTKGAVQTQYSNMQTSEKNKFDKKLDNGKNGQFFVPENVYIIGTMNDIDRSVESMDFAFRRRFAFVEIEASESENALYTSREQLIIKNAHELAERMQRLNTAIIKNGFSSHYQIGVAYFLKFKDAKNYTTLWNDYIKGTLYEYLRGEPQSEIDTKMKNFEEAYYGKEETEA